MFEKIVNIIKKLFTIFIVSITFGGFALWGYLHFSNLPHQEFNNKINDKIKAGETEISIKDIVNFEWKKVCVFGAYNFDSGWKKHIGSEHEQPYAEQSDGIHNFLFVKEDGQYEVLNYYYPLNGEISNLDSCVESKNAKITYVPKEFNGKEICSSYTGHCGFLVSKG